jgi:hypothetical protein
MPAKAGIFTTHICQKTKTPRASFNSYPELTHGFSHYTGYKKWRYTIGPNEVAKDLK